LPNKVIRSGSLVPMGEGLIQNLFLHLHVEEQEPGLLKSSGHRLIEVGNLVTADKVRLSEDGP